MSEEQAVEYPSRSELLEDYLYHGQNTTCPDCYAEGDIEIQTINYYDFIHDLKEEQFEGIIDISSEKVAGDYKAIVKSDKAYFSKTDFLNALTVIKRKIQKLLRDKVIPEHIDTQTPNDNKDFKLGVKFLITPPYIVDYGYVSGFSVNELYKILDEVKNAIR